MEVVPRVAQARPIMDNFSAPAKFALVGLSGSGKSTLFRTLTNSIVPLVRIQTEVVEEGVLKTQHEEFDWLCKIYNPGTMSPAIVKVFDTPGLDRAAHFRKGIGNSFLDQIVEADILLHICRAFEDPKICHVDGEIDPIRDLECVRLELQLKDIEKIDQRFEVVQNLLSNKKKSKPLEFEFKLWSKALVHLREGKDIRLGDWNDSEAAILKQYKLLTAKPNLYLINVSEDDMEKRCNKFMLEIMTWVQQHGADKIIPFSGTSEENPVNQPKSKLPKIISTCFGQSKIIHFFTADADEIRSWQLRSGTRVSDMASSFGRRISSVKVVKFQDIKGLSTPSDIEAESKITWMTYVIQDGDILFFTEG